MEHSPACGALRTRILRGEPAKKYPDPALLLLSAGRKSPPSSPGSFSSRTPTGLPFPHGRACFNRSVQYSESKAPRESLFAQTSGISAFPPSSRPIAPPSTNNLQLGLARSWLRTHFSSSVWSGRRSRSTPQFLFLKGGTSSQRPTASFRLQPMNTNYYHSSVNANSPLPPRRILLCNYRYHCARNLS